MKMPDVFRTNFFHFSNLLEGTTQNAIRACFDVEMQEKREPLFSQNERERYLEERPISQRNGVCDCENALGRFGHSLRRATKEEKRSLLLLGFPFRLADLRLFEACRPLPFPGLPRLFHSLFVGNQLADVRRFLRTKEYCLVTPNADELSLERLRDL